MKRRHRLRAEPLASGDASYRSYHGVLLNTDVFGEADQLFAIRVCGVHAKSGTAEVLG
ncbi:MAG: hypothetical protein AAF750_02825 [Planctomycetota bacterium]